MKKLLVALVLSAAGVLASFGKTTSDYVQDGLIACWDGYENGGWDLHDPNATYPVELVNGLSQTLTGTIAAHDLWFELGSGDLRFTLPEICTAINEGHATVEICFAKNGSLVANGGLVALGTATRGFWTWQNASYLAASYSYHAQNEYTSIHYRPVQTTVNFMTPHKTPLPIETVRYLRSA